MKILARALSPENTILSVLLKKEEKKEVTQCIRKIDSRRRYKVASIPSRWKQLEINYRSYKSIIYALADKSFAFHIFASTVRTKKNKLLIINYMSL